MAIVIPAYNAERLAELILGIRTITPAQILVVDDGSDPAAIVPLNVVDVELIRHAGNMGKGSALLSGFRRANELRYRFAITCDADFQHDPSDLEPFLEADPCNELVLGRREFGAGMPIHRKLSNWLTSWILSVRCGTRIHDSQNGFRRYHLPAVLAHSYLESGFQFESEVLIRMIGQGRARLVEVPIKTIYNDSPSSIHNFLDTFKFIHLIFRSLFWRKK